MIHIKDNYYIRPSQLDYVALLVTDGTNANGEKIKSEKLIGYYTTIQNAIIGIKDYYIREELTIVDMELYEAIKTIKEITDEFSELLERLTNG